MEEPFLPVEVQRLHPVVLEIGLGITDTMPATIDPNAISAAREVLTALAGEAELRQAARSLVACARTLELEQQSPGAASQIMSLLHEPEILGALRALEAQDKGAKAFDRFSGRAEEKRPATFGQKRAENTMSLQQLGVRRFL